MLQADRISDAFKGGRADPNRSLEELERFYLQAKWLGECAEYIYPPPIDHSNEFRSTEWAPIWKCFVEQHSGAMITNTDGKADREKWEIAVNEFVTQLQVPSNPDKLSKARDVYNRLDENGLDAIADKLQSERRALFPTWLPWKWFSVTDSMREASQKYELAHRLWSTRAESRIRDYIIKTWAAEGSTTGGVTTVEFNSKNGIEYFLASNDELVILCFRGTEMNKMSDIITDMLAWQVEIPEKRKTPIGDEAKARSSKSAIPNVATIPKAPKFHAGFWNALHGVWEQIEKNAVWEAFKSPTKKQVWITGHSLGGALATLAAYRLVRDDVITAEQISGVFTFGQPRVGDGIFVGGYSETRERHYRFVNNCDIVTMIPPRSIRWLVAVGSKFFRPGSSKKQTDALAAVAKKTDSETLKRSYEYADVGNIFFVNRANRLKQLQPRFWWPFELTRSRIGSLLRSPFVNAKYRAAKERFLPVIADHSMQEYNRVLKIACAHCSFVREAVAKMKARPELQKRSEKSLLISAEKAWARLKAGADRVAWDAKQQHDTGKAKPNKLLNDKPQPDSATTQVEGQVAQRDDSKSDVWLTAWHAALSKNRDQAIENVITSLR